MFHGFRILILVSIAFWGIRILAIPEIPQNTFVCQDNFNPSLVTSASRRARLEAIGQTWKPGDDPVVESSYGSEVSDGFARAAETPDTELIISHIVAMSENNVIGIEGGLPWSIPKDYAYYLSRVEGRQVIAGRVTAAAWDEEGAGMEDRCEVNLLTRNPNYSRPGCEVHPDFESALEYCRTRIGNCGNEVFVLGGGTVYEQTMKYADRLYITEINMTVENGDTFYPDIDLEVFREIERHPYEHKGLRYDLVVYERK